jgi:hypothetical protein
MKELFRPNNKQLKNTLFILKLLLASDDSIANKTSPLDNCFGVLILIQNGMFKINMIIAIQLKKEITYARRWLR